MRSLIIIDDSITMRTFLTRFLEKEFVVKAFETADSALDWLKKGNRSEIIVCDLNLPGMSGIDFISYYRNLIDEEVPIVVLSGSKDRDVRLKCMEIGANDYVDKPFLPKELLMRINQLLADSVQLKTVSIRAGVNKNISKNLGILPYNLGTTE